MSMFVSNYLDLEKGMFGTPVSDHDLILCLLVGLGPNYLLFVNGINIRETIPSLNSFHNMLDQYKQMVKRQNQFTHDQVCHANSLTFGNTSRNHQT